jgi:hypothetical protein
MEQPFAVTLGDSCQRCKYRRTPRRVSIRGTPLAGTPDVAEAVIALEQEYASIRQQEEAIFFSGEPFVGEPQMYAWCWMFTPFDAQLDIQITDLIAASEHARAQAIAATECEHNHQLMLSAATGGEDERQRAQQELDRLRLGEIDSVRGAWTPYYALCARMNNVARPCPLFTPTNAAVREPQPIRINLPTGF